MTGLYGAVRHGVSLASRCPWFSVLIVSAALLGYGMHSCVAKRSRPLGRVVAVEPLSYYKPNVAHEILNAPQWRLTGRTVSGVPVVEPADDATRKLAEKVLGKDAAERSEFLFVGELGHIPHGADVYVVSEEEPAVEVPEDGPSVDVSGYDFPAGVTPRKPTRMILVPRPAPLFEWRQLHQVEAVYQWDETGSDYWFPYRPGEFWIKGRAYLFLEAGVQHDRVNNDSGPFGRAGLGVCLVKRWCR